MTIFTRGGAGAAAQRVTAQVVPQHQGESPSTAGAERRIGGRQGFNDVLQSAHLPRGGGGGEGGTGSSREPSHTSLHVYRGPYA